MDQLVGASTSIRACGAAGELQDDIAINSDVPAGAPNAVHTQAGNSRGISGVTTGGVWGRGIR